MDRYDENLILGYVEGDLPDDQRTQFEASLAADPVLRELVTALAADRAALRRTPQVEPPDDLMEPVHQQLERSMLLDVPTEPAGIITPARSRRLGRMLLVAGVAAMLGIVAGILVPIFQMTFSTQPLAPTAPGGGGGGGDATGGMVHESRKDGPALADRQPGDGIDAESSMAFKNGGDAAMPGKSGGARVSKDGSVHPGKVPGGALALAESARGGRLELGQADQFARLTPQALATTGAVGGTSLDSAASAAPQVATPAPSGPTDMDASWQKRRNETERNLKQGGTLALAAGTGPRLRVTVVAADPGACADDVVNWAISNRYQAQAGVANKGLADDRQVGRQREVQTPAPNESNRAKSADAVPAPAAPSTTPAPAMSQLLAQQDAKADLNVRQVTISLPANQVPQLMTHLNARSHQSAQLVDESVPASLAQATPHALDKIQELTKNEMRQAAEKMARDQAPGQEGAYRQKLSKEMEEADKLDAPAKSAASPPLPAAVPPAAAAPPPTGEQHQAELPGQSKDAATPANQPPGAPASIARQQLELTDWSRILNSQLLIAPTAPVLDSDQPVEVPIDIYQSSAR
ncbi:MAG: hypothetical protein WD042_00750 [Phycisphaeraceae bacterium]